LSLTVCLIDLKYCISELCILFRRCTPPQTKISNKIQSSCISEKSQITKYRELRRVDMRGFRHRSNTLFLMGSQLSCGYFVFGNTPLDSWPPTSVPQASLYLLERANLAGWRPSHFFSYLNSSHNIISIAPFFPADTSVYK